MFEPTYWEKKPIDIFSIKRVLAEWCSLSSQNFRKGNSRVTEKRDSSKVSEPISHKAEQNSAFLFLDLCYRRQTVSDPIESKTVMISVAAGPLEK